MDSQYDHQDSLEAGGEVSDPSQMKVVRPEQDESYVEKTSEAPGSRRVKNQLTLQLKHPPMSPVFDQDERQSAAPNFAESMRSSLWPKESHLQIKEDINPPTLIGWQSKLPHINLEIEPFKSTALGHGFQSGNNSGQITGRFS